MSGEGIRDSQRYWVDAKKVRHERLGVRGWTVLQLEGECQGLVRRTINRMESGEGPCLGSSIRQIAAALSSASRQVAPSELIDWEKSESLLQRASDGCDTEQFPEPSTAVDIRRKLDVATREASVLKSCALFREVVGETQLLVRQHGFARLCAEALTRLAELEQLPRQRQKFRRQAISTLEKAYRELKDWQDLVAWANRLVDVFYEEGHNPGFEKPLRQVAEQIKAATRAIKGNDRGDTHRLIVLLAQRSSLLRCLSILDNPKGDRARKLMEMGDCAAKALSLDPDHPTALAEHGQAIFHQALFIQQHNRNYEDVRTDFESKKQEAERSLIRAADMGDRFADLVLARLYRKTYEDVKAVDAFWRFARVSSDKRRVWAEAHIVGEAVRNLFLFRKADCTQEMIDGARDLLAEAVKAGHRDARNIVDLAFLQGICKGAELGGQELRVLAIKPDENWQDLLQISVEYAETHRFEALYGAFVFGMDQGGVWEALGTFVMRFLNDEVLANRLYDVATKLSGNNAAHWLNLFRTQRAMGHTSDAQRCLNEARRLSNPAFRRIVEEAAISE